MGNSKRSKLQKALVGPAGEHYVLFRLFQMGYLASLAPPGTPIVDVLVLSVDASIIASIQVKTRTTGADGGWPMSIKHETMVNKRLFYAFVDLESQLPTTYVVPSSVVAKVIFNIHRAWLASPGLRGKPHNDNELRRISPGWKIKMPEFENGWMQDYHEKWEQLNIAIGNLDS